MRIAVVTDSTAYLSHEQYDPATQTFQGRQISLEEPEVTYTFQADGPDKFIFKSNRFIFIFKI